MPKRKNDMQKLILEILTISKKKTIPFLTHKQIVKEMKILKPREDNIERKVSQAIWLLGEKSKRGGNWKQPKLKTVYKKGSDGKDHTVGYTIERLL